MWATFFRFVTIHVFDRRTNRQTDVDVKTVRMYEYSQCIRTAKMVNNFVVFLKADFFNWNCRKQSPFHIQFKLSWSAIVAEMTYTEPLQVTGNGAIRQMSFVVCAIIFVVNKDLYYYLCVCVGLNDAIVQQQQPRTGARDDDVEEDDDDVSTELSFKCLTDGRPTPSVEWLRNYIRSVYLSDYIAIKLPIIGQVSASSIAVHQPVLEQN